MKATIVFSIGVIIISSNQMIIDAGELVKISDI